MAVSRFGLPPELFAPLFPFHLVFDQKMEIAQAGAVLERICLGLSVPQVRSLGLILIRQYSQTTN